MYYNCGILKYLYMGFINDKYVDKVFEINFWVLLMLFIIIL